MTIEHCGRPAKPVLRIPYKVVLSFLLFPIGLMVALIMPTAKCTICNKRIGSILGTF